MGGHAATDPSKSGLKISKNLDFTFVASRPDFPLTIESRNAFSEVFFICGTVGSNANWIGVVLFFRIDSNNTENERKALGE